MSSRAHTQISTINSASCTIISGTSSDIKTRETKLIDFQAYLLAGLEVDVFEKRKSMKMVNVYYVISIR